MQAPEHGDPGEFLRTQEERVNSIVYDSVQNFKGSISAEHGIGQMKREELLRLSSPARMGALRAIKAAMDPHGIFNPGKLLI